MQLDAVKSSLFDLQQVFFRCWVVWMNAAKGKNLRMFVAGNGIFENAVELFRTGYNGQRDAVSNAAILHIGQQRGKCAVAKRLAVALLGKHGDGFFCDCLWKHVSVKINDWHINRPFCDKNLRTVTHTVSF